jgi:hypothetical protein
MGMFDIGEMDGWMGDDGSISLFMANYYVSYVYRDDRR